MKKTRESNMGCSDVLPINTLLVFYLLMHSPPVDGPFTKNQLQLTDRGKRVTGQSEDRKCRSTVDARPLSRPPMLRSMAGDPLG